LKHEFGQRLRKLREEKHPGLSLRKLAEKAGVEPGYLSKIERGLERASEETIVNIAKALGESEDVLLAMDRRVSTHLLEMICKHPDRFRTWIESLDKMPEEVQARAVERARTVKDGKW
jgi:transcriptional regulator with XRE-family HTH domain